MDLDFQKRFSKIEVPVSFRNSKSYIFEIVILIVAAVLLYWFIVIPKAASLKDKKIQFDQVQAARIKMQTNLRDLEDLAQKLPLNSQNLEHLDQALPLNERQVRTQGLLEKLIQNSGVIVGNLTVSSPSDLVASGNQALLKDPYTPKRSLGTITVSMSVSGSLSQLLDLVNKLENYGRIMEINSLNLSAAQKGALNLNLSLNTYYFAP